uniref:Uncharacterized protein n=1 Tax=Plectus sambesii TaxID=2011161 RepID=A0A914V547_9BILA
MEHDQIAPTGLEERRPSAIEKTKEVLQHAYEKIVCSMGADKDQITQEEIEREAERYKREQKMRDPLKEKAHEAIEQFAGERSRSSGPGSRRQSLLTELDIDYTQRPPVFRQSPETIQAIQFEEDSTEQHAEEAHHDDHGEITPEDIESEADRRLKEKCHEVIQEYEENREIQ